MKSYTTKKVTLKLAKEIALKVFGRNVQGERVDRLGEFRFKSGLIELAIFIVYGGYSESKYPHGYICVGNDCAGHFEYKDGELEVTSILREKYDLAENLTSMISQSVDIQEDCRIYPTVKKYTITDEDRFIEAMILAHKIEAM